MGSAPAVLSPTGTNPSIGGADVAAFLPASPPPAGPGPGPGAPGPSVAPRVTLPKKLTAKALAALARGRGQGQGRRAREGHDQGHRPGRAPRAPRQACARGDREGRRARRRHRAIRLRLNALGRKRVRRLKGARLTLRIVHGSRSVKKVVKLR